jgi:hypothetical protein
MAKKAAELFRCNAGQRGRAKRDGEALTASEKEMLRAIDANFREPVCEADERTS